MLSNAVYIDDRPLAVFRFVYRSRGKLSRYARQILQVLMPAPEALMNEMVIPREASPDPLDTLSATELRRLARERLNMLVGSH